MSLWAIVPVKPFSSAKSRLAAILSPGERAGLSRGFMEHALNVLAQVPAVVRTLVISRDSEALALARERGAYTVTEAGALDLNRALRRATQAALGLGARAVLILPTDLPLLQADEVRQMAELPDGGGRLVVIAPDRHESGTNALLVCPPGLLAYAFGPGSFGKHLAQAGEAGAEVRLFRQAGTALDVDLPDDYRDFQERRRAARASDGLDTQEEQSYGH